MEDWTKIATTDLHDIDCFIKFDHAQKIHIQWDPDITSSDIAHIQYNSQDF